MVLNNTKGYRRSINRDDFAIWGKEYNAFAFDYIEESRTIVFYTPRGKQEMRLPLYAVDYYKGGQFYMTLYYYQEHNILRRIWEFISGRVRPF